jgi:hypothetical protein
MDLWESGLFARLKLVSFSYEYKHDFAALKSILKRSSKAVEIVRESILLRALCCTYLHFVNFINATPIGRPRQDTKFDAFDIMTLRTVSCFFPTCSERSRHRKPDRRPLETHFYS